MKMVKSLLLVSAAGLVAVSGAQAADLPVKAKAVEYVKVCSLYGAGYYYSPGSDICVKIGGFVRWMQSANTGNSMSAGPFGGTGGRATRADSQDFTQRSRSVITHESKQQTAYGTLRTYMLLGFSQDSTAAPSTSPAVYMTRGFIEIAGFTFGKATSFFDFASTAAAAYNAGMMHNSDTGDGGQMVAAYTANLGNGFSASIAAEQTRRKGVVDLSTAAGAIYSLATLTNPTGSNLSGVTTAGVGQQDIVGAIRFDQKWGSVKMSVAAHDVSASYDGTTEVGANSQQHPSNKWGYAYSLGLRLNAPMFGAGDYFQGQIIHSQGATGYISGSPAGNAWNKWSGNTVGYGFFEDAVYSNNSGSTSNAIQLTTGWSMFASYEHFWTPALKTSLYGTYVELSHNDSATNAICTSQTATSSAFQGGTGCNPDWNSFGIGSRTQWNVTKDLYIGLDVIYQKLNTATSANGLIATAASGAKPATTPTTLYNVNDQSAWAASYRIHRDIVP